MSWRTLYGALNNVFDFFRKIVGLSQLGHVTHITSQEFKANGDHLGMVTRDAIKDANHMILIRVQRPIDILV